MFPKYTCLNCGTIWRSGEIMVICPVCRGKPIKIKDGVDIKEVINKLKGCDVKKIVRNFKGSEKNIKEVKIS